MKNENLETTQNEVVEAAKKESKTLADYGLAEGEVVNVVGCTNAQGKQILAGRTAQIVKASKQDDYVKAQLFNAKGELQKTTIALPVNAIEKQTAEVVVA